MEEQMEAQKPADSLGVTRWEAAELPLDIAWFFWVMGLL